MGVIESIYDNIHNRKGIPMRLWTAQTVDVYESLIKTGTHHCDESKIRDFEWWKRAYDWLAEKMTDRIGAPPANVKYPVWLWYKWNSRHRKPDLRSRRAFGPKGRKMVMLEIEIPDDKVVLSDFDNWHSVLNNYYSCSSARSESEYDKISEWLDSLPKDERQIEIEKSWDSIFDITPFKNEFAENGTWVQATVWELKSEHIIKVFPFTC